MSHSTLKPFNHTDAGNAERLFHLQGSDIRFCTELREWFVWNQGRWARDHADAMTQLAVRTARSIRAEAKGIADAKERNAVLNFAQRSESAARLRAMIEIAQSLPEIHVNAADLDADPYLLGCENGTLDLRTGMLRVPIRGDLMTETCGLVYDPHAQCLVWEAFLERVLGGNWDLIEYLRRWTGYALTGSCKEQQMLMLVGEGANGKSTFLNALRAVWGDYARQADLTTFLKSRSRSDNIRNDVARLAGARLVIAVECGSGCQLDEVLVKQLTGGDTIAARQLYKEHREFSPILKLFFAANELPVIASQGHAIWRRIRVVAFNEVIAPEDQDRELSAKLAAEAPGILNWALIGCLNWQQLGLEEPDAVKESSKRYRDGQDTIREFIEQHCQHKGTVQSSTLYAAFCKACHPDGTSPAISQKTFSQRLSALGFVTRKVVGLHHVEGLSLNAE